MATFKTISSADIKTTRSNLNQLIDFVEEDVSGSTSRKSYQVFVTGTTADSGVTSSLYQTVFDQNFQLQTANELFDLTVGLFFNSEIVTGSQTGTDGNGKLLFPSQSLMMREKVNNYRQFAQLLLGDANSKFYADNAGKFSLGDALSWDGTSLVISGSITVTNDNDFASQAELDTVIAVTSSLANPTAYSFGPSGLPGFDLSSICLLYTSPSPRD